MNQTHETVERQDGVVREVHTTVYKDAPRSDRGAGGWVLALVLVIALVIGGYFLLRQQDNQLARDAAVTDAAQSVGEAARQTGQAIEGAAAEIGDAVTDRTP